MRSWAEAIIFISLVTTLSCCHHETQVTERARQTQCQEPSE